MLSAQNHNKRKQVTIQNIRYEIEHFYTPIAKDPSRIHPRTLSHLPPLIAVIHS